MREIQIDVAEIDIAIGNPRNAESCALALAGSRALAAALGVANPAALPVQVCPRSWGKRWAMYVKLGQREIAIDLPAEIGEWARAFDDSEEVDPISFKLQLPEGI